MSKTKKRVNITENKKRILIKEKEYRYKNFKEFIEHETLEEEDKINFKIKGLK